MPFARRRWPIAAGLVLLIIGAFWPTFQNGFVGYDDPQYVWENPIVLKGLTIHGIAFAWTTFLMGNWNPLTWMSLELDSTLFGHEPWGFHTTSLLLHVSSVLLYFSGLWKLTGRVGCSAIAAALFAIHPLRVESVAWISERKDVLSVFFLLVSLWGYGWHTRRPSRTRYGLFLAAYVCGLLSKPMLVTLPVLLFLIDFWPLNRLPCSPVSSHALQPENSWRRLLLEKVPVAILALIAGGIAIVAQDQSDSLVDLNRVPILQRVPNAIQGYFWYLKTTFLPFGLAPFYPLDQLEQSTLSILLKLLVLIAITAMALLAWRKRPHLFVGWFWFIISLLPVSGLMQVGDQAYADRYSYVPHLGFMVAIVWEAALWSSLLPGRNVSLATLGSLAIAACGVLTFQQVKIWHDKGSLWHHAIAVGHDSYPAQYHLAVLAAEENRPEEAEQRYRRAIALVPDEYMARTNLGLMSLNEGRTQEAVQLFEEILKIHPNDSKALFNRARIARLQGDYELAAKLLRRMREVAPRNSDAPMELGQLALEEGDWTRALREFETATQLAPQLPEVHNLKAMVLAHLGRPREAIAALKAAVRLDPNDVAVRDNLGALLAGQGLLLEALEQYAAALELDPNDLEAREQTKAIRERLQEVPANSPTDSKVRAR
jgi:tetratricopeptide (TPR) repeat protein